MRGTPVLVRLDEPQLLDLDELAAKSGLSRPAVLRRALAALVEADRLGVAELLVEVES